jgi:hypothetical protein
MTPEHGEFGPTDLAFGDEPGHDNSASAPGNSRPKPYFVPPDVDWEQLPAAVKTAFNALIQPTYSELVLGAANSLERSAGMSLTFLLWLELIEQFSLAAQCDWTVRPAGEDSGERDKAIRRYLRVVGAKQQAANFLARLQRIRGPHSFGFDPLRPPFAFAESSPIT